MEIDASFTTTLPTHVYVSAAQKQAERNDAFFYVRHRGDETRGTLLVIVDDMVGQSIAYRQIWDGEKRILSEIAKFNKASADKLQTLVEREISFDQDIWIIEIEDKKARLFFDIIVH